MSISGNLPSIFQNAYYRNLLGGGSSLSGMQNSSLGGLGFGGLTPGLLGGGSLMGTNTNPLAGQSAIRGLGEFTQQVMYTDMLRDMGYLPSTQKNAFGGTQGGGGMMAQLMQMFAMLQAMMGGGQQAAGTGTGTIPVSAPASFGGAPPQMMGFGGGVQGNAGLIGGGGGFFSRIGDNFASIDTALNQALGSVMGSMSLARL